MVRNIMSFLSDWVLPPRIHGEALKINATWRRAQLGGEEKSRLALNHDLSNKHRGQTCFILATGPSIKQLDLLPLCHAQIQCIAVANFFAHELTDKLNIPYYCIAPFHPPITEEAWSEWLTKIGNALPKTTQVFSITDFRRNEKIKSFEGHANAKYLHFGNAFLKNSEIDLSKSLPSPWSVGVMALYWAVGLGYKNIYLLGYDHNYLTHYRKSGHFYEEKKHTFVEKGVDEWENSTFEMQARHFIDLMSQYRHVHNIAKAKNIEITNLTPESCLEIFPKANYTDVIKNL
jgi:hypothetical protein